MYTDDKEDIRLIILWVKLLSDMMWTTVKRFVSLKPTITAAIYSAGVSETYTRLMNEKD